MLKSVDGNQHSEPVFDIRPYIVKLQHSSKSVGYPSACAHIKFDTLNWPTSIRRVGNRLFCLDVQPGKEGGFRHEEEESGAIRADAR